MSNSRKRPEPLRPEDRHRFRRLTDDELADLCAIAKAGDDGATRAITELWDLILAEVPPREAWSVQDYAIAVDQADVLKHAMRDRPDLPERQQRQIWLLWLDRSPADYDEPRADGSPGYG